MLPEELEYKDTKEFFNYKMEKLLKGTSFVLLLDPQCFLELADDFICCDGSHWKVYRYTENDINFRQQYKTKPDDPNFKHIVWVTGKKNENTRLDLTYIPDVVSSAHEIIDFSLRAILKNVVPGEDDWPEIVYDFSEIIVENLTAFLYSYKELKKELGKEALLNKNDIRRIVISIYNSSLQIKQLMFKEKKIEKILQRYLEIVLLMRISDPWKRILRSLVLDDAGLDLSPILPWLELSTVDLAQYLYANIILDKYDVPNRAIMLRGLGIFGFDISGLEKYSDEAIRFIRNKEELKKATVTLSEKDLSLVDINKVISGITLNEGKQISNIIMNEEFPLLVFAFSQRLLQQFTKNKELNIKNLEWSKNIHKHKLFTTYLESPYFDEASMMLYIFEALYFVLSTVSRPIGPKKEFTEILKEYTEGGIHKASYLLTKAIRFLRVIEDAEIRKETQSFLESLKNKIEMHLEQIDEMLCEGIEKNWQEFRIHPRLSINVIREMIMNKHIEPSIDRKLWVLVFDGMRYDTWTEIVKPILCSVFEVVEEKPFLSPLPSLTDIARISLLAQRLPDEWKDYENNYTSDHNILVSRGFGLGKEEGRSKLRVTIASETDFGQKRLDAKESQYNILIYNLSDDWIHAYRGDIYDLNEDIRGRLEKNILPDLKGRISDDDYVLVTSDHGFIELEQNDGLSIKYAEPFEKNAISYRYLKSINSEKGIKVKYRNNEFYTVAKGKAWFKREQGKFSRYAHGGVSMQEMTIPGVFMRKITVPFIDFDILCENIIVCDEDSELVVKIGVKNIGNKKSNFSLSIKLGTRLDKSNLLLNPQDESTYEFKVRPTLKDKNIVIQLSFKDINHKEVLKVKNIALEVKMRKDKVEIDTSALEKFDNI